MISAKKFIQLSLAAIVGAAYLALSHYVSVADHPTRLALVVGLLPLAGLALASAWFSSWRTAALLGWALAVLATVWSLDFLSNHAAWLYFVQHAGAMSVLGATFGGTLWRGHDQALCTRIGAMLQSEPLSAAHQRYTWRVTLAWTVFFTGAALLSALLFFWGSIEVWSVFANLLTPVFIGLIFMGEYLVRLRALPDEKPINIASIIQAYRRYNQREDQRQHQP